MVLGNAVICALGVTWLRVFLGSTWAVAVSLGMTPFVLGDLIKVALAAALFPAAWSLVQGRPD